MLIDKLNIMLAEAATRSGNLAIPLVKALTAGVARIDAEAARYVHWGATSQDVLDTAAMLMLRSAIDALLADVERAIRGFSRLALQHRTTAFVARTWLQHGNPGVLRPRQHDLWPRAGSQSADVVSCTSPKGVVQTRKRGPVSGRQPSRCDQISTLAKNHL